MSRRNNGFTLIELMIVVAIIGILASLAIPNFLLFQCKAKQSEVKSNLSSIFSNETGFFAEYNTFGTDLVSLGWQPAGAPLYLYGYNAAPYPCSSGCVAGVPNYNGTHEDTGNSAVVGSPAEYSTAKMIDLLGSPLHAASLPANFCLGSTFQAGALGDIFPDATVVTDEWTMDSGRNLNVVINDCEQ